MSKMILAINPGSTSTKIAIFRDTEKQYQKSIDHDIATLEKFNYATEQTDFRKELVLNTVKESGYDISDFSAVVSRGSSGLNSLEHGGYLINEDMVKQLLETPQMDHASNVGPLVAKAIADAIGVNSYIYDAVVTDELTDITRMTGLPMFKRICRFHALNSRAMAYKVAAETGQDLYESNYIVCHMGGGISASLFINGRAVDYMDDDEMAFSPERAGQLPQKQLIDLCFSGKYTHREIMKMCKGNGGVKAHLGTADMREVDKMIENGDGKAKQIVAGMIYRIAKAIGGLATGANGKIDAIVLTGGIAYDNYVIDALIPRIEFIAPVHVKPGENEMEALAEGTHRIINENETVREYVFAK